MSCENPVLAHVVYEDSLTGKMKLTFKQHTDDNLNAFYKKYGRNNVFELPCGKCESCRKQYAQDWAVRLSLERPYWKYAYFITLTYDEKSNPFNLVSGVSVFDDSDQSVKDRNFVANTFYKDIQNFIRRFRLKFGSCCYFGVSEFGSNSCRFHYHLIIFTNSDSFDRSLFKPVLLNGHVHYHSSELNSLWKFGLHDIARFEHYCGAYVAKYTAKDKVKCFMSQSIGKKFFFDHYKQIIDNDLVIYGSFGKDSKVFCPRFMVPWFKEVDDLTFQDIRKLRSALCNYYVSEKMRGCGCVNPEEINSPQNRSNIKSKKRGDF